MTADNTRVELVLVGRDEASVAVRTLTESIKGLEQQAKALGAVLGSNVGAELARQLDSLNTRAKALGTGMGEASEKVAQALKSDTTAARELRDALREVAQAQNTVARGVRTRNSARSPSTRPVTAPTRDARQRAPQADHDDFSGWRTRQRIKANSERIERRDAERERVATASAAAAQVRAQHDAFAQRLRDQRYLIRVRERSEAAEMRHFAGLRREHDALRRRASTAGRHTMSYGRHAINSVNHPVLQSPGFWLHAGAIFGVEAGKHLLESARSIDAATARYRMMPGVSASDAASVRANALREGIRIGLDPAEVVRLQLQGMKDGLSKDIAGSLPAIVNAAVQTMGGSIERDGDELAKAVREASTVGWVKDATGARSLMNQVASLSTFNGNSPEKMQQFLASGGIGRGKELGWSQQQTLAFGAALNGSGERTGLGSARLMAQIPEIRAQMRDRFMKSTRSHTNSEENRAARAAPRMMGYGGISEMQQAFATPEGVTDFLSRLSKLPEQTRAAIEKAYGLGPQFNSVAAEMGADHGARYHEAFKREQQLSSQVASNDDLSKNSKIWSASIDFMIGQLKASVEAIQSELGDVIKDDILTPFTKWWVEISELLINGGMKADFHQAITSFVGGLGFSDITAALNALRASVGTFDFAGFMRGVGEGLRVVIDDMRWLASAFNPSAGGLSAEAIGKLAAEMFGLSAALHLVSPVVTTIAGIASAFLAMKAVLEGAILVSELTGITAALKGIVGVELATTAAGLVSFAGALGVIATIVQGLISAGILNKIEIPHDMRAESWDRFMWGRNKDGSSARPEWFDRLTGGGRKAGEGLSKGPHGGLVPTPQSYEGGGSNWRDLLTPAAYTDDASAGDRDRTTAAVIGTQRAVQKVADLLESRGIVAGLSLSGSSSQLAGFGGGGGEGGGNANLRYGRGVSGGWHSTPGTGSYGNPSKSLLDLIAQSEGAGYNVSWGNGRFLPGGKEQNLTGKSLNEILALGDTMRHQPGARNSSALGRYQITGSTLRDLMGRLHLSGNEKFDEAMQDRLASKLISDEGPRALQRWEGLKRGTYMSRAQALLRSGSIASQPGAASFNGGNGNAGKAVDIAMSMQGAGERSAQQILGAYMHPGEWCADFVNGALKKAGITGSGSAMAASFSKWGKHVDPNNVAKGDVITERHGNHVGHVGMATGNVQRDKAGNVTAVEMISGNYGNQVRKNWEKLSKIDDLRRAPTPEGLAASAGSRLGASGPASRHAPGRHPIESSAEAGPRMVNHFHINGAHDAKHVADKVVAHLNDQRRRGYRDVSIG